MEDNLDEMLPKSIVLDGLEAQPNAARYSSNLVHTHRYTLLNFLPLQVYEQLNPFSKFANFYFLCVGCMQAIPQISITGGVPVLFAPLLFVTGVDAITKLYEDYQRRRADALTNRQATHVLDAESRTFEPRRWDEVRVGDVVCVRNREIFPADLLLLGAMGPQGLMGHCWVSTKSLDGETDAKLREAPKPTSSRIAKRGSPEEALLAMRGKLRCEAPNNITSDFAGLLYLEPESEGSISNGLGSPPGSKGTSGLEESWSTVLSIASGVSEFFDSKPRAAHASSVQFDQAENEVNPINEDNMLLRGCQLRNTKEVYGLVVTAGVQTKIQFAQPAITSVTQKLQRGVLGRALSAIIACVQPVLRIFSGGAGAAGAAPKSQAVKTSAMTSRVNIDILGISMLLLALSVIGVTLHFRACEDEIRRGHWLWYLAVLDPTGDFSRDWPQPQNKTGLCEGGPQLFGTYFLLSYNLIPVSLYVSISMVYLTMSLLMASDLGMYDPSQDQPAVVRTMSLCDELGRISHVLSDKTGTLTANHMRLRRLTVGSDVYGSGSALPPQMSGANSAADVSKLSKISESTGHEEGHPYTTNKGGVLGLSALAHDFNLGQLLDFNRADAGNKKAHDETTASSSSITTTTTDLSPPHTSLVRRRTMSFATKHAARKSLPSHYGCKRETAGYVQYEEAPGATSMYAQLDDERSRNVTQRSELRLLLLHLASNHSVLHDAVGAGTELSASSPDELALVSAAEHFGYEFTARDLSAGTVLVRDKRLGEFSQPHAVELLAVFPYVSSRKRMSTVVRLPAALSPGGTSSVYCFTKGADSVILALLASSSQNSAASVANSVERVSALKKTLDEWANEALRTLVFACRRVPDDEYRTWFRKYTRALEDPRERAALKAGLDNAVDRLQAEIEKGLLLQGGSAVEDELQAGVPETLRDLSKAGVKVWMLTGDKVGTAKNIAAACSLLPNPKSGNVLKNEVAEVGENLFLKKGRVIEWTTETIFGLDDVPTNELMAAATARELIALEAKTRARRPLMNKARSFINFKKGKKEVAVTATEDDSKDESFKLGSIAGAVHALSAAQKVVNSLEQKFEPLAILTQLCLEAARDLNEQIIAKPRRRSSAGGKNEQNHNSNKNNKSNKNININMLNILQQIPPFCRRSSAGGQNKTVPQQKT